ncbi:uncharacterized protein [Drosophila virilis]|uniref:Uncharacterized protein n=1 Tax=Drosophila virilis TaxID=7244 RepID=B4M258_DROVI|nr:uncharacterized protein LOC6631619 [Drosophila virilis]EDW65762.1 uncharacterized protein Dvir_GJ18720 [Drosophila virilis]
MKAIIIFCSVLGLVLLSSQCRAADCDEVKNPDDSDFKNFFKNFGCKVKQGAGEVADAARPYAEKIGEGAKDFTSSVAQKYDELKHRLTDDASTPRSPITGIPDAPTERVPLAPIAPAYPADIAGSPQPVAG